MWTRGSTADFAFRPQVAWQRTAADRHADGLRRVRVRLALVAQHVGLAHDDRAGGSPASCSVMGAQR